MDNSAHSQDTLLADEDDSGGMQTQPKSVADAEDDPTSIGEKAEDLQTPKLGDKGVVEPLALVEQSNIKTDPATPIASLFEDSASGTAPERHIDEQGDSNVETHLPEAATAAGAIGLASVGALGFAKVVGNDDEDKSPSKESPDNADINIATAAKHSEAWWASSMNESNDLIGPAEELEPEENLELLSTAPFEEEHGAVSQKNDTVLARDVDLEAWQLEAHRFEATGPKKSDALDSPIAVSEESEQTIVSHDDGAVKDGDETSDIPGAHNSNGISDGHEALPVTKKVLTKEAEGVSHQTNLEVSVVQDHDSADEAVLGIIDQGETPVSEASFSGEGMSFRPLDSTGQF